MGRIKLSLPPTFLFSIMIPVRITDLNYSGHLSNDSFLSLIHEARIQFLEQFGFSEMNFSGVGLIMSDVSIEFKNEAFYGDNLHIEVATDNFSRVGFDLFYRLSKANLEGQRVIVAIAKTGMICFNYANKKVVSLPEEAHIILNNHSK